MEPTRDSLGMLAQALRFFHNRTKNVLDSPLPQADASPFGAKPPDERDPRIVPRTLERLAHRRALEIAVKVFGHFLPCSYPFYTFSTPPSGQLFSIFKGPYPSSGN